MKGIIKSKFLLYKLKITKGSPMMDKASHQPDFPVSCSLRMQMDRQGSAPSIHKVMLAICQLGEINLSSNKQIVNSIPYITSKSRKFSLVVFPLKSRNLRKFVKYCFILEFFKNHISCKVYLWVQCRLSPNIRAMQL